MRLAAVLGDSMNRLSLLIRTVGPVFWLLLPLAAGRGTQLVVMAYQPGLVRTTPPA